MQRFFFQRYLTIKSGQRGWRRYIDRSADRAASHIAAFTIVSFSLVNLSLKWSSIGEHLPIPIEYIQVIFIYIKYYFFLVYFF